MKDSPNKKQKDYPVISLQSLKESEDQAGCSRFPSIIHRKLVGIRSTTLLGQLKNTQQIDNSNSKLPEFMLVNSAEYQRQGSHLKTIARQTKQQQPNILTAAHTLQNQYIANKIDIDMGTLSDFLDDENKLPISSIQKMRFKKIGKGQKFDVSNGKKGTQALDGDDKKNQDEQDEEKEFDIKKSKYTSPLEILKHEDDEKRRNFAAKQIIQQIFRANFGEDVERFEENNAKQLYLLKNQDDIIDQDNQLSKFLKKNARKPFKEKLKVFHDQLDEQNQNANSLIKQGSIQNQSTQNLQQLNSLKQGSKQFKGSVDSANEERKKKGNNFSDENSISVDGHESSRKEQDRQNGGNVQPIKQLISIQSTSQRNIKGIKNGLIKHFKTPLQAESQIQMVSPQVLRSYFILDQDIFEYRFNYVMDLKFRSHEISQLWSEYGCDNETTLTQNDKLYRDFIESQIKFYQIYLKRNKNFDHWKDRKKKIQFNDPDFEEFQKEYLEVPREEIFIMDKTLFTIWNQKIESTFIMFASLNFTCFSSIQRLELIKNQLSEGGILVLMEVLIRECECLHTLNLSFNKLGAKALSMVGKLIIEQNIVTLGLRGIELNTRSFCKLCIAIAQRQTIEDLDVSENQLDERSIESIKAVLRYIKNVKKFNISKNNIPENKSKEIKKLLFDAIKDKEIIFF